MKAAKLAKREAAAELAESVKAAAKLVESVKAAAELAERVKASELAEGEAAAELAESVKAAAELAEGEKAAAEHDTKMMQEIVSCKMRVASNVPGGPLFPNHEDYPSYEVVIMSDTVAPACMASVKELTLSMDEDPARKVPPESPVPLAVHVVDIKITVQDARVGSLGVLIELPRPSIFVCPFPSSPIHYLLPP